MWYFVYEPEVFQRWKEVTPNTHVSQQVPIRGYEKYVGHRTTFRMLNNLWSQRYSMGKDFVHTGYNCDMTVFDPKLKRGVCVDPKKQDLQARLPTEQRVTFIISRTTGQEYSALEDQMREDSRVDVSVLMLSPRVVKAARRLLTGYRVRLCRTGRGPYDGGSVPSSGFVAIFLLHNLCEHVSVFGFGNYRINGKYPSYHYYDSMGARKFGTEVHSWTSEQMVLEEMAREGHIRYCVPGGTPLVPNSDCLKMTWPETSA